jgi:ankyrin repeat protein
MHERFVVTVALMVACGPSDEKISAFKSAVRSGDVEAVERLLDATPALVDAEIGGDRGEVALYYAILDGHGHVARALVERGADLDVSNDRGDTPLHWAAYNHCNREVIELMVKAGADRSAKNDKGLTPLAVVESYGGSCSHVVELLR